MVPSRVVATPLEAALSGAERGLLQVPPDTAKLQQLANHVAASDFVTETATTVARAVVALTEAAVAVASNARSVLVARVVRSQLALFERMDDEGSANERGLPALELLRQNLEALAAELTKIDDNGFLRAAIHGALAIVTETLAVTRSLLTIGEHDKRIGRIERATRVAEGGLAALTNQPPTLAISVARWRALMKAFDTLLGALDAVSSAAPELRRRLTDARTTAAELERRATASARRAREADLVAALRERAELARAELGRARLASDERLIDRLRDEAALVAADTCLLWLRAPSAAALAVLNDAVRLAR